MKKNLFILIIILIIFHTKTHSQTLTAIDCNPQIGDVFNYSVGLAVPPGPSGAGQVWDFSTYSFTSPIQITMEAMTDFPLPPYLAGTNIVSYSSLGYTTYFKASSGLLEIVASGNTYSLATFSNYDMILIYPFSLGNSATDTYTNAAMTLTPNYSGSGSGTKTITADGTGTLITPAGTFNNVLRGHMIELVTSSSSLSNTTNTTNQINENYYWYKPGVHSELFAILSSTTDIQNPPSHTISQSSQYLSNAAVYLGIGSIEASQNEIMLFPNPASNELNFELATQVPLNFSIINPLGEVLLEERSESNGEVQKIDISAIKPGLYILQVKSENKIVAQKKFIVVR